ncbi:hypothetical protein PRK78_003877 [Emydomyces testavorans]|uniref:MMS19 nucleotide excision repair protein n=1 Tax=Emydomyces testavorans TaxID=2070801 RepID=A0AAF0IL09_9EURO|nr:hypothetical protein PRK78_003877 [Emydomyces testavorans]
MGELQEFLIIADNDKEGAIRLAEITAQSNLSELTGNRLVELDTKHTTLISIVQSLREYINDEDASIRGKAVSYLTAVIKALPSNFLSRQQIQVLTTFYCERIEDGGAIAGLQSLQGLGRFDKDLARLIARG